MVFSIDPDAIIEHANALGELQGQMRTAKSYLDDHLTLSIADTSLPFAQAIDAAGTVRDTITSYLEDFEAALQRSAEELGSVAQRSIELDDAVEAELDAAYPGTGVSRPAGSSAPSDSGGKAPGSPEVALVTPAEMPEDDLVTHVLTTDWLSPSTVIAEILNSFIEWNYLDEIGKKLGGNWNALYRVSDAIKNVSHFVSDSASNVEFSMQCAALTWSGNASDAATAFFSKMVQQLNEVSDEIATVGPEFETVATGMKAAADTLTGLFSQILDLAIATAALYTIGALTSWTGVGGIVGFLAGSGTLAIAVKLAGDAWEALQAVVTLSDALAGVIGTFEQFMVASPELPKPQSYDNALV
jgi:hypothetical protein